MVLSFYNQIEQLVTQYPDFWDYYCIHRNVRAGQFFSDPLKFIRDTFMYASKKLLAPTSNGEVDEFRLELSDARAAHSVSTFFLGALIAKNIFGGIFSSMSTNSTRSNSYEFSYIWTLTCLYHDCGYALEKNEKMAQQLTKAVSSAWNNGTIEQKAKRYPYWLGIAEFRKNMKLLQSIWQRKGYHSSCPKKHLQKNLINQHTDIEYRAIWDIQDYYQRVPKVLYLSNSEIPVHFPVRKSNEINRYFAYRLLTIDTPVKRIGCIDHGIAGGYLFFDRIIRNYANSYKSALSDNSDIDISNFANPNDYNENPMHFSFDQLPLFAYISDCIINHNIWSERSDTVYGEIYQRMGMHKLIIPRYDRVNFFRNPLLFILAVSDTIEPYKLFSTTHIDRIPFEKAQLDKLFNDTYIEIIDDRIVIKPPKPMILIRFQCS